MSVEFEEEPQFVRPTFKSRVILGAPEQPALVSFLYRKGLVKSENQAGNFLMYSMVAMFALAAAIFIWNMHNQQKTYKVVAPQGYTLDTVHGPTRMVPIKK